MEKMLKRLFKLTASLLLVVTSIVYQPTLVMAIDGEPGEITINKTKDFGNDDEYIITLSVQGNPTEETVPAPVDIVLVLDRSGSMSGAKMTALKTAAKNFVDTILDRNSNSRIAIVSFASNITPDPDGFISDRVALKAKITALNASGGTHLEGGIYQGYLMLEANTSTRPKSMVVMGDGEPTYGYDFTGVRSAFNFDFTKRVGSGSSRYFTKGNNTHDLADSVAHIGGWVKAKYDSYSIGLSVNNAGKTVLQSVQNKGYWDANSSNLDQIFNLIAQDVTNYHPAGTDAVVTDQIGAEFEFAGFVGTYPGTAVYDNNTRLITWALGNIEATTKVLKYKVVLKADAPAGKEFTNEFADLDYTDPEGVSRKRHFPKPEVIIIRYVAEAGGTVTRAIESMDETQGVAKGSTANPAPDYLFVNWTNEAGAVVSTSANYIPPKNSSGKNVPATYTAHFTRAADIRINYIANAGGTVSSPGETLAPVSGVAQGSIASANTGYAFVNWSRNADGTDVVSSNLHYIPPKVGSLNVAATYYANFAPRKDNIYRVEYYFKDIGASSYSINNAETINGTATTGDTVTAPVKTFTGFTENLTHEDAKFSALITGSGIVVLKRFYTRNNYTITYNIVGDYFAENAKYVRTFEFGAAVSAQPNESEAGYVFSGWSGEPTTMPAENLVVEGSFTPSQNTQYQVRHHLKDLGATTYTEDVDARQTLSGTTGQLTNAAAKTTYVGFVAQGFSQIPIAANGSTIVNIYYNRINHTITYLAEANGAIVGTSVQTVEHGGNTSSVNANANVGYHFVDWDDGNNGATRNETNVTADATYTARFAPNTNTAYRIEYYLRDLNASTYTLNGDKSKTLSGTTGANATIPSESFDGFVEDETHSDRLLNGVIAADGSLVLKRFYNRVKYTITYQVESDGVIVGTASQQVEHGGSTTEVTANANAGYHFVIWLEDGLFNPFRHEEDVRANATYTARMAPNEDTGYRIEYHLRDLNADTYTLDGTHTKDLEGTTDEEAFIPEVDFEGFEEDIEHEDRLLNGTITADGLLVLKRFYNRKEYVITYLAEDHGSIDGATPQTVQHGGSTSSVVAEAEAGYHFVDWDDGNDGATRNETNVRANATYTARFAPNEDTGYRIEYHLRDLNADTYSLDATHTKDLEGTTDAEAFIPEVDFEGFEEDLEHEDRLLNGTITADGLLVLKRFYDRKIFTITYLVEANGEIVGIDEQTVQFGDSTEEVIAVGNSGYHFERWLEDGLEDPFRHEEDVRADATYTARMAEDKNIEINYWANLGGDVSLDQESLAPVTGVAVGSEAQEHAGYEFINWTSDEEGLDEVSTDLHFIPEKVDGLNMAADYYANFKAIDYTFTFDPNHDEDDAIIQTFNVGGSVEEVGFSRSGFRFIRWTLDAANEEAYEGGFDELPAQDIYIFAQWEEILPDEYVLTYVSNQPGLDIPNVIFNEGDAITPVMPMVDGFEFLGWFIDEDFSAEFMEFGSMPARNVTVYADWGEVLGDEDEEPVIPVMGDFTSNYAMILLLLGILGVMISKKEESTE